MDLGIYSDVFADLTSKVTCQGKYVASVANLLKKGQVLFHHQSFQRIAAAVQTVLESGELERLRIPLHLRQMPHARAALGVVAAGVLHEEGRLILCRV